MSETSENAIAYVRYVIEKTGLAATELAKKSGLSSSTLTRPLNSEDHKFNISTTTIGKIEESSGIKLASFLASQSAAGPFAESDVARRDKGLSSARRAGAVEAGAWREVDEFDQSEADWQASVPDKQFPQATQEIYDVSGDSMNNLEPIPILPGAQVVSLRYEDVAKWFPLRTGLVVVVQRTRDGGHVRELSVKQVEWHNDRIEFCPRSKNKKHQPIVIEHDSWEDNGVTVEVLAVVRRIINDVSL